MLTHSINHFIIPLGLKVAIYTKFFSLCPLAAYMLLLLEAPRFKLLKSQAFKLFSSILGIYFGRDLYLWFSSVNLILHCSYDYYTQPFFLSVYISLQSMLQDPTPTFSYSCCLTIFIKKNLYFIFTYLIINMFFARTYFKNETTHGTALNKEEKPKTES